MHKVLSLIEAKIVNNIVKCLLCSCSAYLFQF